MEPQGAGELQQLRDELAALQVREAALRERFEERVGNKHIQRVEVSGSGTVLGSAALGFAAGGVLVAAIFAGMWVSSMAMKQAMMNNWTAQEITAIRAYITTGKLAPMKPRPGESDQPEEEKH